MGGDVNQVQQDAEAAEVRTTACPRITTTLHIENGSELPGRDAVRTGARAHQGTGWFIPEQWGTGGEQGGAPTLCVHRACYSPEGSPETRALWFKSGCSRHWAEWQLQIHIQHNFVQRVRT